MEKFSQTELELPPGFRFHPTDEELITHYLSPKVLDNGFSAIIIGEIDLNKVEPWELPRKAKMGEKEWYFFCKRDRKYPTGLRTNRASGTGYWKATGRDKDIFKRKILVGKKKSLVFYKGRAHKGEKSNWLMHEYRLVGRNYASNSTQSSKATKDEWVICRIYNKSSGGKKTDISELPALMDFSSDNKIPNDFLQEQKPRHNNLIIPGVPIYSSSRISDFSQLPLPFSSQFMQSDLSLLQQQSILGLLLEQSNGLGSKENANMGFSVDSDMCYPPLDNHGSELWAYEYGDQEFSGIDIGPVGLDCLWNC